MSPVSKMSFWRKLGANRMALLGLGAFGGVLLIAVLSAAFTPGSALAKLLLDYHGSGSAAVFPYPLTIQNVMWVMFGIAVGDSIYRHHRAQQERRAIGLGLLPEKQSTILTKDNMPEVMEKTYVVMQKKDLFLPRLIHSAGMSFQTHSSPEQAHEVMSSQVDLELHRSDLRYTLLRYIAWLLPTLGFIGTVVGISAALAAIEVDSPAGKDPSALVQTDGDPNSGVERKAVRTQKTSATVTTRLALAFNTTILALLLSIIVVLLSQFLHKREEEIINAQSEYCLNNLIVRLYNPEKM